MKRRCRITGISPHLFTPQSCFYFLFNRIDSEDENLWIASGYYDLIKEDYLRGPDDPTSNISFKSTGSDNGASQTTPVRN
ncbi:hypothetical protein STEG23_018610 [Scotinomys teguina]